MSILSVDIGGTIIKYALMSRNGDILSRGKIAELLQIFGVFEESQKQGISRDGEDTLDNESPKQRRQ